MPPDRPIPSLVPVSSVDFDGGRLGFTDGWHYAFHRPGLLKEAMTMRGMVHGAKYPNQKMAIHGDKVLEIVLSGVFLDQDHSTGALLLSMERRASTKIADICLCQTTGNDSAGMA